MFLEEEEIEVEEETEEETADPKLSLWERNRQALRRFLDWRKKRQEKPRQLTFSFNFN
jgi:hypothetical protein